MSFKIPGIPAIPIPDQIQPFGADSTSIGSGSGSGSSFSDVMKSAIGEVESSRSDANEGVNRFLSGEGDDLHSVILASQRAELEFDMFLQVRNKVVSAYQEIMRLQM
jgi:flagellar hook-basal body complex protein FliE